MKHPLFLRWVPLLCLVLVLIAGVTLRQRNSKLVTRNNRLTLQNDSILSVNLQLSKEISKLQCLLDSLRLKNGAISSTRN
ncbi:hypothetical protein HB364_03965 [Pseudoflavitalea sp. X16]|uniref:hypothetical protein n=1 Tax=Paraflavitalea devenefica TaxID=2716334 RepID=UPI0014202B81|nr:hypothetical protein [Paraflavitalea devenefica]NII24218.1 hypothetical protein [Paraflavitalea devenefica]